MVKAQEGHRRLHNPRGSVATWRPCHKATSANAADENVKTSLPQLTFIYK
jgi:hypothetical protein